MGNFSTGCKNKLFAKYLWGILQKFCVADEFSAENQQINLKPKKLYSAGYTSNLLFDIIAIHKEAFFILIDEFVDACALHTSVYNWFCANILHAMHHTHSRVNFTIRNIF